jgi:glutathione S-transferase
MISSGLILYHGMASTCSKKVRMCLYEKNADFESRLLDLQKFEQHSTEYLAINSNGVVPTLVHNGRSITESSVIIEYIDDVFPAIPLSPEDAFERAQMRLWIRFSDEVAYKAVYAPTWQKLRHRAEEGLAGENLTGTLSKIPTAERRDRWQRMAQGGFTQTEIDAAYQLMQTCLDRAEKQLLKTNWLAGKNFSLADIAILPFIDRIANLRPEFLVGMERRSVREWLSRAKNRSSFEKAFFFKDDPRASELPNF